MTASVASGRARPLRAFGDGFTALSPSTRVLGFAALLALLGMGMLSVTPAATSVPDRAWALPFVGLVLAFGAAEATALHVEIRKESHSLSLAGIPLMFGALYTSPALLALGYAVGAVPTLLWIRRVDPIKVVWNSCLFFAEGALVGLIVRAALGESLPQVMYEWFVPLGAVLAAELLSLIAVPLVIMVVDARFRPGLFATVGQSQIVAALAGTFTVTAVSASIGDLRMMLFAAIPVLGIGAVLRGSGSLSQRYENLQQLHGFMRVLTKERGVRTLDIGLTHLVEVMRTKTAGLLTVGDGEPPRLRLLVDDRVNDHEPDPLVAHLVGLTSDGAVTELTIDDPDPETRRLLAILGVEHVLATRVLGEVDQHCVLFVADRLGMRSDFTLDELRLFGSLADTFSARLTNDHLVAELETQAQHDALTGLPNRLQFEIALTASLADDDREGVVVMLDLDRFKEINDSLGHDTGDRLLNEVARRLRSATRSTDVVSRFGGDEFAMLLTGRASDGPADMRRRIDEIHELLTSKVRLDGITFEIGASLGVVRWPAQGTDTNGLLQRADTAMYQAKRNQLGVVWYVPDLDADAPRRLDLYLSVQSALESEDLYVHLQPKVSLADGAITGAEALVRWTHPAHGPISPDEFVPLIDQAGSIRKLTRFVVERTAQTISTLRSAGIEIPVAVNLTPRDLLDPDLPDDIARILKDHDVEPSSLHVEITEDAMVVDFDTSVIVLTRLREMGVRVALDDFGTGYSSLQHLHRLPVDQLKIDRSFVMRMADDNRAAAIVRASINLARDLEVTSVAEGVEDAHTLGVVAGLGCDEVQGYHTGRPLPTAEFMRWAIEWHPESFRAGQTRAEHALAPARSSN